MTQLSSLGKSFGRRGWISQYLLRLGGARIQYPQEFLGSVLYMKPGEHFSFQHNLRFYHRTMNLFYVKFLKLLGIWPNIKFSFKDKQSDSDVYSDASHVQI